MSQLDGKIALVTGGNSGIGYATAKEFKDLGATVIITGRSSEKVQAAARELGVEGLICDVREISQIDALARTIQEKHGRVDVLFVNAGIFFPSPVGNVTEEIFDETMEINFKGAVFTVEKLLPLISDGGSIINLSSVNAYTGMTNTSIYAASKAAMNSYTRTAATELAPRGIRVNAINPGPVETPIFGKTGLSEEQLNGFAQMMQNRVPMKRFGKPEEIAKLASFLASEESSFMTGSEINIDGGIGVLI